MSVATRQALVVIGSLSVVGIGASSVAEQADVPEKAVISRAEQLKLLKRFASEFVKVTPGKGKFPKLFQMGSVNGPASEKPVHTVTFDYSFSVAKYEVPQNLFEAVIGHNPSVWGGPRNSVEMVSWNDADQFCARISKLLREAKLIEADEVIRLPTEAEWEYFCRAGTNTAYSFGDAPTKPGDQGNKASKLDPFGWHTGNAAGNDPPVGALKPNAWGLYDVHGYLWEYVSDAYHPDYNGAPTDGSSWGADKKFVQRVMRGGSWRDRYESLRSASRLPIPDHAKSAAIGFRCVKSRVRR